MLNKLWFKRVLLAFVILLMAACARIRVLPPSQVRAVATAAVAGPKQPAAPAAPTEQPRTYAIELNQIVKDLDEPVFLTHAKDGSGRLYIIEQAGIIYIYENGALREKPFLDIKTRVGSSANEQGLLGLAFSPKYKTNGHFFVNYTDKDGDTVVARFSATKDRTAGDAKSELRILKVDQPYANHNGGMLAFGPDGMLYIGLGDGGSGGDPQNHAQNMKSWLGKMLRIDVSKATKARPYSIPKDNPKWGNEKGVKAEIWSLGLRNPWRYSFDSATGDLYIADVGQNAREEVSFQPAGRGGDNYGWKQREGFAEYSGDKTDAFVDPVVDYKHGDDGCSVTGGYVYRGTQVPELVGTYLYGDYCSGKIWALKRGDGDADTWLNSLLFEDNLRISSFGEDEAGELYVVDHGGVIYKMEKGQ